MNVKLKERKDSIKTGLIALALIASSALLFGSLTEASMAAEFSGSRTVPTSYNVAPASSKVATPPQGYQKSNYAVVSDPLEYYQDKKPTAKDLTETEAADLGAQMVWEVYGADLKDATIYMGYDPGTETFPRATWSGDVRFDSSRTPENPGYTFIIDAVTGERFNVFWGRILEKDVPLGLDMALANNPKEYEDLAKSLGKKLNLVGETVKSATYNCQGYSYNDPTIDIDLLGTNGERASMSFSRYDQKLLALSYDTAIKISEESHRKFVEEVSTEMEKLGNSNLLYKDEILKVVIEK